MIDASQGLFRQPLVGNFPDEHPAILGEKPPRHLAKGSKAGRMRDKRLGHFAKFAGRWQSTLRS
jgi:hypothetical protein